jgi:protein-disulfide isomerase
MKMSKRLLTGVIVSSVVVIVLIVKFVLFGQQAPATAESFRTKGKPGAKIQVVEYTDFQCPACAKASVMIDEVFKKYPDKAYLELKYFPLPRHNFARKASIYADCAGAQGKFWPFHDVIFKSQSSWDKMSSVDEYFMQLAVSLGLDGGKLDACVKDEDVAEKIAKDVESGKARGVNSTPTFFVNGKMIVGGQALVREIETLLGEGK